MKFSTSPPARALAFETLDSRHKHRRRQCLAEKSTGAPPVSSQFQSPLSCLLSVGHHHKSTTKISIRPRARTSCLNLKLMLALEQWMVCIINLVGGCSTTPPPPHRPHRATSSNAPLYGYASVLAVCCTGLINLTASIPHGVPNAASSISPS